MTGLTGELTRDLQRCFFTLLCVEWAFASLGFAVILSTVGMIYRIYGISITISCLNFTSIMVPQIFPSRGFSDPAREGDRLSGEQLVELQTSVLSGLGPFC